ncbi:peptidylprolyl isomerase [Limnoglobus roseus]|uniref:peptidylprolyl isomerase n=1 Tax=Limnoglobus roseus TaxID=2598579 RepID=A0A5C1A5W2_9BACT|nr:peptidylprolyl isomerase [Limnoglobus roseus]QEL13733.1 peptidyl-prolyl cis-trans isomerase [Limnoglobus roseus]
MPRGIVASVTLLVFAPALLAQAKPATSVAATVNGEPIRLDEVDAMLKRHSPVDAPLTTAQAKQLRAEVLNDLIDLQLLTQFLKQHGPQVPPADLDKYMQGVAASLRKQKKTLADHLKETGQTEQQVRDGWTRVIQLQRLIDQKATEAELKKYFEANRVFFENATVRVSHIVLRLGPTAPAGEQAVAMEKLKQLRLDILAGKIDFASAAKKHSVCPTARTGGDLGYITRKDAIVDEPFAAAAFALKPNEISDVVACDDGLHLILVTARKAGTPVAFEKVVDQVRDVYADEIRQSLLAKLRKDAKIEVTLP